MICFFFSCSYICLLQFVIIWKSRIFKIFVMRTDWKSGRPCGNFAIRMLLVSPHTWNKDISIYRGRCTKISRSTRMFSWDVSFATLKKHTLVLFILIGCRETIERRSTCTRKSSNSRGERSCNGFSRFQSGFSTCKHYCYRYNYKSVRKWGKLYKPQQFFIFTLFLIVLGFITKRHGFPRNHTRGKFEYGRRTCCNLSIAFFEWIWWVLTRSIYLHGRNVEFFICGVAILTFTGWN